MSLHIVLGFNTERNTEEPAVVFAGRAGEASREAIKASTFKRHLVFDNIESLGVRKHNSRAEANRAAADPQAVAERARQAELERLAAEGRAATLAQQARAEAEATVKAREVAKVAVEVVKDAIAQVATEAASASDSAEADDSAAHFSPRRRK